MLIKVVLSDVIKLLRLLSLLLPTLGLISNWSQSTLFDFLSKLLRGRGEILGLGSEHGVAVFVRHTLSA